jgi:hypothetical protein
MPSADVEGLYHEAIETTKTDEHLKGRQRLLTSSWSLASSRAPVRNRRRCSDSAAAAFSDTSDRAMPPAGCLHSIVHIYHKKSKC